MSKDAYSLFVITLCIFAFSVPISAQEVYQNEEAEVYDNCVGCSPWMRESFYPASESGLKPLSTPTGRIGTSQNIPILERNKGPKENEQELKIVPSPCTVTSIKDGDTFTCVTESLEVKVRLIGVDTPELQTSEGKLAKSFTANYLPVGTIVILEFDAQILDKYQRVLAYVWLPDGTMLNEILLQEGYASIMTVPPNVRYVERFKGKKNNSVFKYE
jgi:micrococcal nuclease